MQAKCMNGLRGAGVEINDGDNRNSTVRNLLLPFTLVNKMSVKCKSE